MKHFLNAKMLLLALFALGCRKDDAEVSPTPTGVSEAVVETSEGETAVEDEPVAPEPVEMGCPAYPQDIVAKAIESAEVIETRMGFVLDGLAARIVKYGSFFCIKKTNVVWYILRMPEYIVSLNDNILKISVNDKEGLRTVSRSLSNEIVVGSCINNVELFSKMLSELVVELCGPKVKKYPVSFLIEPQDVFLNFVTINSNNFNVEEQIIEEIRQKIEGVALEDLYFSYQKIAPFVYQFVGVKKHFLENFLQAATMAGFGVKTVTPWILALPKFLKLTEPCIYVSKTVDKQVVALSEMNGIYFCATYDKEKTMDDLQELVKKLSVYRRHQPINKIYAINYNSFSLDPNYEVVDLSVQDSDMQELKGFELHMVYTSLIKSDPELFNTQVNLLNLLPLPVPSRQPSPVVFAGGALVALSVLAAVIFGFSAIKADSQAQQASTSELAQGNETAVLSETVESPTSTEETNEEESPEASLEELNKEDISIYVENGAGVAGIAGRTRDFLEEQGFVVADIGNAEETGRANTLLNFKQSKLDYEDLVVEVMSEEYEVVIESDLAEDSEYDLVVTVGLN